MIDIDKIDSLFNEDSQKKAEKPEKDATIKHTLLVHRAKLLLPSIAAILIGLLAIFPALQKSEKDFLLDITRPQKGELEKLHIEKTILNITDKDNKVNNFTAENIDETSPGSKLIKLSLPDGVMPTSETDWINIKAPVGFFNQETNILNLINNVEIFYSSGMNLNTEEVTVDFKTSDIYSNKPVAAQGHMGDMTSQGFIYHNSTGILVLTGKTHIKIKEDSLRGNN